MSTSGNSVDAQSSADEEQCVDVGIVGAGFGGMYMLHRVRQLGLTARVFEAGTGVGGTWYWNRYPGARCDVESLEYSYSFDEELQQEWSWSERYSGQPEILAYANHVADRFDLRSDISFNTRVEQLTWDGPSNSWSVSTDGDQQWQARFMVMATGCLSSPNKPEFDGMDSFDGEIYHTGEWPHEPVDFTGKRVAVIGTGSSAIQSIPIIASQAAELTVLQRTPNYSVPAHNRKMDQELEADFKANYPEIRAANLLENGAFGSRQPRRDVSALDASEAEAYAEYEARWREGGFAFMRAFSDLLIDDDANSTARRFVADKIAQVVEDPATAALLTPEQVIGCKRLCLDSHYFETFNLDHVSLLDVKAEPISGFNPTGLRVGDTEYEFDAVVMATGFDAMTGSLLKIDIAGLDGQTLAQKWHAGPRTYLGLSVPGFPNMFMISGPGSPSVLTNMITSIEQHVDWISRCLATLERDGVASIRATEEAEAAWVDHVNEVADATLMPTCNSWYLGANIPGKQRVFMPLIGFPPYVEKCDQVEADGYQGFVLA